MFIFLVSYEKHGRMKTKITKYTCPVCNSHVWETVYQEDPSENGYACYWGHIFTKDDFLLDKDIICNEHT